MTEPRKVDGMGCFMRTLVLRLFNRSFRPSFSYVSNGVEVTALLDSGAETPINVPLKDLTDLSVL